MHYFFGIFEVFKSSFIVVKINFCNLENIIVSNKLFVIIEPRLYCLFSSRAIYFNINKRKNTMRQINKLTDNTVKLKIENLDDLWVLNTILDSKDIIRGKTLRKINLSDKNTEKSKVTKKPMFLAISTEKITFNAG